jgi:hypothetical protein
MRSLLTKLQRDSLRCARTIHSKSKIRQLWLLELSDTCINGNALPGRQRLKNSNRSSGLHDATGRIDEHWRHLNAVQRDRRAVLNDEHHPTIAIKLSSCRHIIARILWQVDAHEFSSSGLPNLTLR